MNKGKQDTHMSHAELAKVFGVSRATIQRIERGAVKKIKDALEKRGIKSQDFLGEK